MNVEQSKKHCSNKTWITSHKEKAVLKNVHQVVTCSLQCNLRILHGTNLNSELIYALYPTLTSSLITCSINYFHLFLLLHLLLSMKGRTVVGISPSVRIQMPKYELHFCMLLLPLKHSCYSYYCYYHQNHYKYYYYYHHHHHHHK
jgi:hypothetical protein